MKPIVFIPTRNRLDMLAKTMPRWQQQDVDQFFIVCEKWEYGRHKQFAKQYPNVEAVRLPKVNQGVAYSKDWILRRAGKLGLKYAIIADDDQYPSKTSDVARLYEYGMNALGIGIMLPFYGLTFGNQTCRERDDPLMITNGMGKGTYSINVEMALDLGGFDVRLHSFGSDNELVRQAMKHYAATWYVHAGVKGANAGKRYEPGGINGLHAEDAASRKCAEADAHQIVFDIWGPRYISKPPGRLTCRWKNMLDDFVPDWRERVTWTKM